MKRVARLGLALITLCNCGTSGARASDAPEHTEVAMLEVPTTDTPHARPMSDPPATAAPASTPAPALPSCGLRAELSSGPQPGTSTLTLINEGTRSVRLVVPGDGSEAGWRTPVITWVAKQHGKPVKERVGGRCGMMNPIEPSEVFELAPGQRRTISEWVGIPNVDPGTYDVELRYKNEPSLAARKGAGTGVEALLAATDACEVVTKPTKLTVPRF